MFAEQFAFSTRRCTKITDICRLHAAVWGNGSETESSPLSGLAQRWKTTFPLPEPVIWKRKLWVGSLQVKLVHNHHRNTNGVLISKRQNLNIFFFKSPVKGAVNMLSERHQRHKNFTLHVSIHQNQHVFLVIKRPTSKMYQCNGNMQHFRIIPIFNCVHSDLKPLSTVGHNSTLILFDVLAFS